TARWGTTTRGRRAKGRSGEGSAVPGWLGQDGRLSTAVRHVRQQRGLASSESAHQPVQRLLTEPELQALDVVLNRVHAERELSRHFLAGNSRHEQGHDVALSGGQAKASRGLLTGRGVRWRESIALGDREPTGSHSHGVGGCLPDLRSENALSHRGGCDVRVVPEDALIPRAETPRLPPRDDQGADEARPRSEGKGGPGPGLFPPGERACDRARVVPDVRTAKDSARVDHHSTQASFDREDMFADQPGRSDDVNKLDLELFPALREQADRRERRLAQAGCPSRDAGEYTVGPGDRGNVADDLSQVDDFSLELVIRSGCARGHSR